MRLRAVPCIAVVIALFLVPATARTVTDHIGRRVEVPDRPQRIVSLAPSITETLFAIGAGDRVAGVTDYCDYPPEARTRQKVGGLINPSIEAIVALHPDLVLIARETNRRETMHALERVQIPVFVLNAERVDDVFRMIRDAGMLCGEAASAERLAADLEHRSQSIERQAAAEPAPRVFFLVGLNPVITVGHGTFLDDLMRRAGARSVSSGSSQAWPHYSVEEIVRANPQFVLIAQAPGFMPTREELIRQPGWSELKAVQENRIVLLPPEVERPGPRLVGMEEMIAKALHPALFDGNGRQAGSQGNTRPKP